MRIFTYSLLLIILIILLSFSLTNNQMVNVGIWPLEQTITLPAFVWFLGSLATGLILGVLFSSMGRQKQKAKLRLMQKQTEQQAKDAESIRAEAQAMIAETQTIRDGEDQTKKALITS